MADGLCRERWGHTAAMLAMIHNAVPGLKEGDMLKPADFNPYEIADREAREPIEVPISILKAFCDPTALAHHQTR